MSRLGDRVPVIPLEDERMDRIERRVMAAYEGIAAEPAKLALGAWPGRMRRVRWLVPACAAAAAVVLGFYLHGRVFGAGARGGVEIDARIASPEGDRLPYELTTGEDGATLRLGDASVEVSAHASVAITDAPRAGIAVALASGAVACEVAPREDRAPFVVRAGDVEVVVVGTAFSVERITGADGDDAVRVSVTRGVVRVDTPAGSTDVAAGEQWDGPTVIAADDPMPAVRVSDTAAAGDATADPASEGAADDPAGSDPRTIAGAGVDTGVTDLSGDRTRLGGRTATRPPSPDPAGSARGADPASSRASGQDSGSRRGARAPVLSALGRASPARGRPPADTGGALADIMAIEARSPAEALRRFRALALERGDTAEFALYSAAYLEYVRLGEPSDALRTLHHYERRFPRGAHAESALWMRIRILCDRSELASCRAAAHTYLRKYPRGARAGLAGDIVNWEM